VSEEAGPPAPELRVALFTGNYNYIKDGVALTLNRLVAFLEARGIPVLIFAPVAEKPAFESVGEVVPVPSMAIPTRPEYRVALGLSKEARQRLETFRPTLLHIAVPDFAALKALTWAERRKVPVVASYHTRYDTYLRFYGLGLFEKLGQRYMRNFYSRVRRVYPPSESMAEILRREGDPAKVEIWARGVDSELFSPERRDMEWRRRMGIADDEVAISFAGRLVKEKNTAIYMRVLNALTGRGLKVKPLVIGDGPEMANLRAGLKQGVFAGFLHGEELARAYASSDIFFFPSESETFGNVTLEAMASGLPAVNAIASGSNSLVTEGVTGHLVSARDEALLADRLAALAEDPALRKRMGETARARALEFSWDKILSDLLDSYRAVLREAGSQNHGR
jgi:glycosyltransferase involved in cell wall biosynthesis